MIDKFKPLTPRRLEHFFRGAALGTLSAAMTSAIVACLYAIYEVSAEPKVVTEIITLFIFVGFAAFVAAVMITAFIFFTIGIPLYVLSINRNLIALRYYILLGLLGGFLLSILAAFAHYQFSVLLPSDFELSVLAALAAGPSATGVFWLAVRPDRRTR